jgi:hypothetical protein
MTSFERSLGLQAEEHIPVSTIIDPDDRSELWLRLPDGSEVSTALYTLLYSKISVGNLIVIIIPQLQFIGLLSSLDLNYPAYAMVYHLVLSAWNTQLYYMMGDTTFRCGHSKTHSILAFFWTLMGDVAVIVTLVNIEH